MLSGTAPPSLSHFVASICAAKPRVVQLTPLSFQLRSRGKIPRHGLSQGHAVTRSFTLKNKRDFSQDLSNERIQETVSGEVTASAQEVEISNKRERSKKPQIPSTTERLRKLMRTVSYPVAIVTARQSADGESEDTHFGATVSSFNTVALKPEPMVAFNLHESSATLATISSSQFFAVTLLQDNTKGAALADRFAKGNNPSPFNDSDVRWSTQWSDTAGSKLTAPARVSSRRDGGGSSSSAFAILCELVQTVPVGDHKIVIGRVVNTKIQAGHSWGSVGENISLNVSAASEKADVCLNYAHGKFSHKITKPDSPIWVWFDSKRDTDISKLDKLNASKLAKHYQKLVDIYADAAKKRKSGVDTGETHNTLAMSEIELSKAVAWFAWRRQECFIRLKLLTKFPSTPLIKNSQIHPSLTAGEESLLRVRSSMSEAEIQEEETMHETKLQEVCKELDSLGRKGNEIDQVFEHGPKVQDLENQKEVCIRKLQLLQELKRRKNIAQGGQQSQKQDKEARRLSWEQSYMGKLLPNSLPVLRSMLKFYLDLQDRKLDLDVSSKGEKIELSAEAIAQRARLAQSAVEMKLRFGPDFGSGTKKPKVKSQPVKEVPPTTNQVGSDAVQSAEVS